MKGMVLGKPFGGLLDPINKINMLFQMLRSMCRNNSSENSSQNLSEVYLKGKNRSVMAFFVLFY